MFPVSFYAFVSMFALMLLVLIYVLTRLSFVYVQMEKSTTGRSQETTSVVRFGFPMTPGSTHMEIVIRNAGPGIAKNVSWKASMKMEDVTSEPVGGNIPLIRPGRSVPVYGMLEISEDFSINSSISFSILVRTRLLRFYNVSKEFLFDYRGRIVKRTNHISD